MRTKFAPLLVLLALILTYSCKEQKSEGTPSKMQEVIAVHDEVMPDMKTIGELIAELKPLVDTTETGQKYAQGIKDLEAAHKSMMDWMAGFSKRFDTDEIMDGKPLSEQKKQWLLEEEVKVKAMQEQVNSSIARAKALLDQD